jgi:hypothetical protein
MPRRLKEKKSMNGPYPVVGLMKGGFNTIISPSGTAIYVRGKKLNLDMAPKNKHGTIEVLEIRDDGNVWATGVCYYDPRTDTYFPDQEDDVEAKKEEKEKKDYKPKDIEPLKKSIRKTTKKTPRRKSRVNSKDSIGVVESGCIVNIF